MKLTEETFKTHVSTLLVETQRMPEFVDITDRVLESIGASGVTNGMACVFSRHTTGAITIQENEPLLLNDMSSLLEKLVPRAARYGHNDFSIRTVHMVEDECPNGHSHCQHLLLGASENVPLVDGKLTLGEFQRIFMVELDDQRDYRQVLVQIMGA